MFPYRLWLSFQSLYFKITLTRVTTAFFFSSVLVCFTQGIIQSFLYSVDSQWHHLSSHIVSLANIDSSLFLQYTHHWTWNICHDTPILAGACKPFSFEEPLVRSEFRSFANALNSLPGEAFNVTGLTEIKVPVGTFALNATSTPNGTFVNLFQVKPQFAELLLDPNCTLTLKYPNEKLREAVREDATLVTLQLWLLGVTAFAVIYQSVPHLLALLLMRLLATAWSAYTIWRSINMDQRIHHLIGDPNTPCHLDLLPAYFHQRIMLQIVDLVFNSIALPASMVFSWNLIRMYQRSMFGPVGPPRHIVKVYGYFLSVFVGLQLSVFFLVLAMSMWIDQLMNSEIKALSSHTPFYLSISIITVVLVVPWIAMGWFAVRRERKRLLITFLATSTLFIASWSIMFYSRVYRFSFIDWPFFGSLTLTSFVFMLLSAGFSIACWLNFDKGLAHFFYVEKALTQVAFEPEIFDHERKVKRHSTAPSIRPFTVSLDDVPAPSLERLPSYKGLDIPPYQFDFKDKEALQ